MKPRRHLFRSRSLFSAPLRYGVPVILGFSVFITGISAQAGDLLRGGGSAGSGSAPATGSTSGGTTSSTVETSRANAKDALARTTQALAAVQAMQNAARNAAINAAAQNAGTNPTTGQPLPNVPNGLGIGGLQVAPGVGTDPTKWTGAELPTQIVDGTQTNVTIKQTAQQALLNWQTFNVGKDTTITFDQTVGGASATQWIAFNKVSDPSANPSQILGQIKAVGQVYLINTNGIIFGGSSQVNVHTLVASALPINDSLVSNGLLNNPNQEFLFNGLGATGKLGNVTVQAGAKLTAPTTADHVGGRIALIGANVNNSGTISTADGQTILAAGLQVGFVAHNSTDASLRGLDTYVGAVTDPASVFAPYAGTTTNSGLIDSARASITMIGKTVQQLGAINSSTSVSYNGRIDLLAEYDAVANVNTTTLAQNPFLNRSTGKVTLGEDSVTQILPEWNSTDKVTGTKLALNSQINILGSGIHFDNNSLLYAPSADVTINAGNWLTVNSTASSVYSFVNTSGRIDLDEGSLIDVSGSKNVSSFVTSNIVAVELRGTELADNPLNKDGALRGETIYVDITKTGTYNGETWIGTPLADVTGYVGLVQRTVGELTTAGGTVKMNAGEAVVIRKGAEINVSGGWVNYTGGVVQTTRVVSDGQLYDIANATPDRIYSGIYDGKHTVTSSKWGTSETYSSPLALNGSYYQAGFTQGGSGGTLNITAGAVAVDGTLSGGTTIGERQKDNAPTASSLNISLVAQRVVGTAIYDDAIHATTVTFGNTSAQTALGDYQEDDTGNALALPAERLTNLALSSNLVGDGAFGNLNLYTPDGDIVVSEGVTLNAGVKGSIKLSAANITVDGSIIAAGGSISLTALDISPDTITDLSINSSSTLPGYDPTRGLISMGSHGVLNTAAYTVDDRPGSPTATQKPVLTTGGTISLSASSVDLSSGSLLDVSGGVYAATNGKITYGNAGKISISSGRDFVLNDKKEIKAGSVIGGTIHLGGELRGMSGAKGGSLSLQALTVKIGGENDGSNTLWLAPEFFNQGGFSTFAVNGIGKANGLGLQVADGTQIKPVVSSWQASGTAGKLSLSGIVQPEGLRSTVGISLGASGATSDYGQGLIVRGDVLIGKGATINAGPAGSIALTGDTIQVEGSLLATGGSISLTGANFYLTPGQTSANSTAAQATVWLTSSAVLDASGSTLLIPDAYGRKRGTVLAGGSISVSGNILADAGSLLDVSGTSGTLDLLAGESGQSLNDLTSGTTSSLISLRTKRSLVESSAGSITLKGSRMLWSDATLSGEAGGSSATGGTLTVSSGRFYNLPNTTSPLDTTLVVTQSGTVIPDSFTSGIGTVAPADSSGITGGGRFTVDDFSTGGFANLDLKGTVLFSGDVSISAAGRITAGTNETIYATGNVSLSASHISMGNTSTVPMTEAQKELYRIQSQVGDSPVPIYLPPTHGTASITASADLIDVGNLSTQGLGTLNLNAANGDIRGNGTLAVAGDINLTAAQIYPPTALSFTVSASDYLSGGTTHGGTVTINRSGTNSLPLSAGGTLSVYASTIVQNGVLRAPFGTIKLGWDGTGTQPVNYLTGTGPAITSSLTIGSNSVTSVSAIDPLTGKAVTIPYGVSLDGETWLDPAGNDITSIGIPQKNITLSGKNITTLEGSQIDIRGGGDLQAYRFTSGTGGTVDILGSSGSYAIIPGYGADYAPYAPFGTDTALDGNGGYVNSTLKVGSQIYLDGSTGVPAGVYTLLPARYALIAGAYLVTPLSGSASGTVTKADGSTIVSGYMTNGLVDGLTAPAIKTKFEVASAAVVSTRASYTKLSANEFFTATGGYRLSGDAGQLVLAASESLTLRGEVSSLAAKGFRGGLIDISTTGNILISNGSVSGPVGTLVLDSSLLSTFGADSLLIGGVRSATTEGTAVTVNTSSITVDNVGTTLSGTEIILASKQSLTVTSGSKIQQTGTLTGKADTLVFGSNTVAGSGNGSLLRISSGKEATVIRHGVVSGGTPSLSIGDGAILSANSLTLDSTAATSISQTAVITTENLSVSSGRISLQLDDSVTPGADAGLVISNSTLAKLASASSLAVASYSSIDLLGAGTVGGYTTDGKPVIQSLALRAAEIRGLGVNGGTVSFNASNILLDNQAGGTSSTTPALSGSLAFHADTLQLGTGALAIRGFEQTTLTATKSIQTVADGSLNVSGNLALTAPVLYAGTAVSYSAASTGALSFASNGSSTGKISAAGLGSSISLQGSTVDVSSRIVTPSGSVALHATSGDLTVRSSIEAGGTSQRFRDVTKYTSGGSISLTSDTGNVNLTSTGTLDVSAPSAAGDAGSVAISAKNGTANLEGRLLGSAGTTGDQGSFSLDIHTLSSTAAFDSLLNQSGFKLFRSYRVRTGDVTIDGAAQAHSYTLSADAGNVTLTGSIDASGKTGGAIRLVSDRGLTLAAGSKLDASAAVYDSAGKGGSVVLETRGTSSGVLQMNAGSTIDLSVAETATLGDFSGTLQLRAPRIGTANLAIGTVDSTITGASAIIVEGYKTYDLTSSGGLITAAIRTTVKTDSTNFMANAGTIESRILANNSGLGSLLTVRPGAEIINTNGDLTLGTTTSTGATGDWDLSTYRFGAEQVPGILTLRASGDLVFYNSLSDGFVSSAYNSALLGNNASLADHVESWSYRLIAGADFSGADTRNVIRRTASSTLGATTGSLRLGKNAGVNSGASGANATTASYLSNTSATSPYQVIRTGSGDIDIVTGGDIQFRNQISSIYTAGTLAPDQTLGGTFSTPIVNMGLAATVSTLLGIKQQTTPSAVQYTLGGGNVNLSAATDIIHLTLSGTRLVMDSTREMPTNWLYRRGYVTSSGTFGTTANGDTASTTWWIDFTNFFEGVGALGGGNVTLTAGRDISNVDAVAPTNARMPSGTPNASKLVELGGGDVIVSAGRNIDGGVYYVERGHGELTAGGAITTNATRSPSLTNLSTSPKTFDSHAWLPTTLFVGKGDFEVQATKDLLLGPVVNAFLLPQGINNGYWDKTYFSTYSADSGVTITSLGGDVYLRSEASRSENDTLINSPLQSWYDGILKYATTNASSYQPWLRLIETDVTSFSALFNLMPGTFKATAFSGDFNLTGSTTLSPSATGNLEILAAGSVNGTQQTGLFGTTKVWTTGTINMSDADPSQIYGITTPYAYQNVAGTVQASAARTITGFLANLALSFSESGATSGITLSKKQRLHASTLLHAGDTNPVRIYADSGDISGFTLYSPKASHILAGNDIRDISLYLQNLAGKDTSIVAAGRDIIAYDTNTDSRVLANSSGNTLRGSQLPLGDIQISGPGTLEVLAGRDLDLGSGAPLANGTGAGIVSIGNARNPYLGFDGADVIAMAGMGDIYSLDSSKADFTAFINKFVLTTGGAAYLKDLGFTDSTFGDLTPEQQKQIALQVFFFVLRDAGRDYNNPASATYGTYENGKSAVATLFPGTTWDGDILTRSRDIRTKNGGDISLLAPGGGITLAQTKLSEEDLPSGIVTEYGGNIHLFTDKDVNVGVSRIFTLRGGNEILWSTHGSIAAGSAAKTVQAAPPTRVIIDSQSANVQTDLAGLATGGGIGVLTAVAGVKASDVDLIAPEGTIDAGDAGIRVSGNLNIAAAIVLNASNISTGGASTGTPATSVSTPSIGSLTSNSTTAAGEETQSAATAQQAAAQQANATDMPSLISVEVIGYGGYSDEEEDKEKDKDQANG